MTEQFHQIIQSWSSWNLWEQFRFVQASPPETGSIFGLAEYLASLALFLVVMTTSDFRYSYRLSLTRFDLRKVGLWIGLGVGVVILVTDVWFQNGFPVPKLLSNANNIKAVVGFVYLIFVFHVISVAVTRAPIFSRRNSGRFFGENYHLVHQGNPERLQILAEELRWSIKSMVTIAAKPWSPGTEWAEDKPPQEKIYARDFLLLIGDRRFCNVVVDRVPAFAFACFLELQKHPNTALPIFQFSRNIGQEFIRNTNSSFYQEDSGFYSGLVGYARPATKIIFGSYQFIERCASDGESPIDTDYREFYRFNKTQMDGYTRAALAFFESYLIHGKGRAFPHSYALARMFESLKGALSGVSRINGKKEFSNLPEYGRLEAVVSFIRRAENLVNEHAAKPRSFRISDPLNTDVYDDLAKLIFEAILAATFVSSPEWTSWSVQHNAVWSDIFSFEDSPAHKIIKLKVRRLLYKEIKSIDSFANFKNARILGYCLNILGLTLPDRHHGYQKEFYPLHAAALQCAKRNFARLLADQPRVAKACLIGSVTYDRANHRLVETNENAIGKEPIHKFFDLD